MVLGDVSLRLREPLAMNGKERVRRALQFRRPDRCPVVHAWLQALSDLGIIRISGTARA